MTKADLTNAVASATGVERVVVKAVLDCAMTNIRETIANGGSIFLRGFGTFSPRRRAEKPARNISNGSAIVVPSHIVPHFKPCREFKEQVNE